MAQCLNLGYPKYGASSIHESSRFGTVTGQEQL